MAMNEYEAQFFGFSSHGFINFYFNNLVESWAVVVENELLPPLVKLAEANGENLTKKAKTMLRDKLLDRLFQNGKLDVILTEAQNHLSRYIIKIPKNVTFPEDKVNLDVKKYDEDELLEKADQLSREILELQFKIKKIKMQRQSCVTKLALAECLISLDQNSSIAQISPIDEDSMEL